MATKKIVDAIPPVSGREYKVTTLGNGNSKIEDVTQYEQEGSTFGAKEVLEGCFVECDYELRQDNAGIGWHLITTENQNPKNIKFFATHDFEVDDKLYLGQTELTIFGVNKLKKGDKVFLANTYVFGFIKENTFYPQNEPILAKRIVFNSKNPDIIRYAQSLMQSGFDGTVNIQVDPGADAPTINCMGQIITNGANLCTIIIARERYLYTCTFANLNDHPYWWEYIGQMR